MGECGCTSNDTRYTMRGPGTSLYIITLSSACQNCDSPPGVTIEHIRFNNSLYKEYSKGEFTDGDLPFEKWPDSAGCAIVCGHRRHEFVNAIKGHLIGLPVKDFTKNGKLSEIGAETILEEAYEDSLKRPEIAGRPKARRK